MTKPTVLLNDLATTRPIDGVSGYARELFSRLPVSTGDLHFLRLSETLAGKAIQASYRSAASISSWPTSRSRWEGKVRRAMAFGHRAFQHCAKRLISHSVRRADWSVYHEPDGMPFEFPGEVIVTVHDITVLLFPQWHPAERVRAYEARFVRELERANRIIVDATSTKADLERVMGIQSTRIHVIPLAPRSQFQRLERAEVEPARSLLGLPERFILFVGTIEPRKNIVALLRAYAALPPVLRKAVPLILAGGWGWHCEKVREMLSTSPWNDEVRWIGRLSDRDLVVTMNAAEVLVYPSWYEGFGLPPLEAMACGTPVITTHGGSLKEVIGNAARIVHPGDEADLARAMQEVLLDEDYANSLRMRGLQHVARYSWDKTAHATANVYRDVLGLKETHLGGDANLRAA